MADPLSLAASVIGVVSAAFAVVKKLHELVDDFKEAPSKLNNIADQIEHNAVLLQCTLQLIQEHEALFKDELRSLIRDVNGHFANISNLFERLLPKPRGRRRDKFKIRLSALWSSKKIGELVVKLDGVRNSMSLILNIAQLAQMTSSGRSNALESHRLRAEAARALDDCRGSAFDLQQANHQQLPFEHRKLLTFDVSPLDMAVWMALHLSAPSVPTRALLAPAESRNNVQVVKTRSKAALPFGRLARAQPRFLTKANDSAVQVAFQAGTLDIRTLQLLEVPYHETRAEDGTREIRLDPQKSLESHQVDLVVGMDLVVRLPRPKSWTIQQAPFMYLPKLDNLGRLLSAWTTLPHRQIAETLDTVSIDQDNNDLFSDSDSDSESDSDGGADTATNLDGEEEMNAHAAPDPAFTGTGWRPDQSRSNQSNAHSRQRPGAGQSYNWTRDPKRSSSPPFQAARERGYTTPNLKVSLQEDKDKMAPSLVERLQPRHGPSLGADSIYPGPYSDQAFAPPERSGGYAHTLISDHARPKVAFWPPQLQVPPPPPSPPLPVLSKARATFPETVGDETGETHRPVSPSMLASPLMTRTGSSAKRGADRHKGKEREDPIHHFQKKYEEKKRETAELSVQKNLHDGSNSEEESIRMRIRQEVEREFLNAQRAEHLAGDSRAGAASFGDYKEDPSAKIQMEHFKQQALNTARMDALERTYAEWKRKEEHERRLADDVKLDGLRTEFSAVRESVGTELKDLKARLAELEGSGNIWIPESPGKGWENVFSHMIVEYATTNGSTVEDDSHAYEFVDKTSTDDSSSESATIGDDKSTDRPRSFSEVERSRPWKGPSHLGNFAQMVPFYVRGSDSGQTWYRGAEPIYAVEFRKDYDGDPSRSTDLAGNAKENANPYLLVSNFWVDASALDNFGFRFAECPRSGFFLNPALTSNDIQVLVDFTFALREVQTFKWNSHVADLALYSTAPPKPDFFTVKPSFPLENETQNQRDGQGRVRIIEWTWAGLRGVRRVLDILNILLHTV